MQASQPPPVAAPFNPWRFWFIIGGICALVIAASMASTKLMRSKSASARPLLRYHQIPPNLEATERSGGPVNIASLNGKVRIFAYIYTICPHGCAAVIGEMLKLQKQFGQRDDFHQVSISVVPEHDTAATMAAYAEGIGLKPADPWWFLTGKREPLWQYMTEGLRLEPASPIPEEERLHPLDIYAHDLRVVLVDREGYVRGYYSIFHPQPEIASLMCERLQQDTQRLLKNPKL
ncbi:SCO family protein [Phragmitibacter flavus]|uniref:SCO family protein n=1 Tax=Phragmitibacter flavus TaxID=2576071 RepID=A0A5R8KA57_9BACT|nr:SCO family protein [Phragmitibacter flavus]TLD69181.1 SCO family protein [Phragmitibacter flavus]